MYTTYFDFLALVAGSGCVLVRSGAGMIRCSWMETGNGGFPDRQTDRQTASVRITHSRPGFKDPVFAHSIIPLVSKFKLEYLVVSRLVYFTT